MSNGHHARLDASDRPGSAGDRALGRGRSGRKFVVLAATGIALIWGSLYLTFLSWRANHRALAAFGAAEVAPLVDPLADRVPPGVSPRTWHSAVADTHAMLATVTSAGLLDRPGLEALRAEIRARVDRASPETEIQALSDLWDAMQKAAGPVLSNRSSRPPFAPPRPKVLGGK